MGAAVVWDATGSLATKKGIDVAFEKTSGDILWMWADATSTDQYYRTYSAATLSAATLLDNAQAGGVGHWVDLAPNPTSASDQILFGVLDAGADLNTFLWSGTAWSAVHTEHSAATEDILDMNFDLQYETHSSNPNDAWLVWGDGATVSRKLWDGGTSAWAAATTSGDDTAFVTLGVQPNSGAFFAGIYEDDTAATDDLTSMRMTGGVQTWSSPSALWSGPVRRNLGLTQVSVAGQAYSASTEAMMVYDIQSTSTLPKYQTWNGSAWSAEASATAVTGEIRYMVLESSPARDEAILVVQTSTGQIQAQVWNGSTWGSVTVLSTHADTAGVVDLQAYNRAFDVAYQASGTAYVVYGDGTADPNYQTWNGTTWSSAADINIPTTGIVNWVELASSPATDVLGLIVLDSNVDVYGTRWNGTLWDPMGVGAAWDTTGATATRKSIDVAIENNSGDVMWMWADATSTDQYYRTYSASTLSAVTLLDNANAGGLGNWVKLAPNPTASSDQILFGVLDAGADLNTFLWSGTAWSAVHTEHSAGTEDVFDMNFDIEFETHSSNPNDAWLVWGDSATVSRKLWDGGTSAWAAATTTGDDTAFVDLEAQPNSGAFFSMIYEDDTSATDDLRTMNLSGGSQTWGSLSTVWSGPVRRNLSQFLMAIAGSPYVATVYEQAGYRFFVNSNSADVGSPLGSLNTAVELTSETDPFRLRMLVQVGDKALSSSSETFKLQYVDPGVGTCVSPSSGTPSIYTDVTTSTHISYYNNAAVSDGASATVNINDPTDGGATVNAQSYEEANNFTNSVSSIAVGAEGLWDFSLFPNGAESGASYCFRIVKSSGTVLDTYTEYPSVSLTDATLSFSISDNTVGFGTLSPSTARFATGDQSGTGLEAEAHSLTASTNASSGYTITVIGASLTDGAASITAMGGSNIVSSPGTEQFGLRATVLSGTGTVSAPYAASGYAYAASSSVSDELATGLGDSSATVYSLRYLANIAVQTEPGSYSTALSFLITGNF